MIYDFAEVILKPTLGLLVDSNLENTALSHSARPT